MTGGEGCWGVREEGPESEVDIFAGADENIQVRDKCEIRKMVDILC